MGSKLINRRRKITGEELFFLASALTEPLEKAGRKERRIKRLKEELRKSKARVEALRAGQGQ
jgi:hypothetical protein